ncbi:photosystem I protein M (PsaM) [Candidatus Francisella endociliophora]|uniref:Photosystem I protein M (PsaM) n=1 Tax=Candidatus Francisella endociliophora TaxID=653937 RepID=A0A097EQP3_9GAMM|nr:hypothetical protein [Francisella sp. FSC1006]AIT09888.1 photosystem I protein M (PsaM) [Francisella sp. FSC1006]
MLKKFRGVTIVELLVATAIAVTVFAMAINIYVAAKNNYNNLKDRVDTEVKELTTKRLLYNFVKNSGLACHFGFTNQNYHNNTGDTLDDYFTTNSSVIVGPLPFSSGSSFAGALEEGCSGDCFQAGSDYIMVKKEENHVELTASNSSEAILEVSSVSDFSVGDYLALCNKDDIDLVKVGSVNSETNNLDLVSAPSSNIYYPGDYVGQYSLQVIYIRDTGEQDEDGNDIFSLYIYIKDNDSSGMSYELVRGIEDLQVEYATVSDGNITWNVVSSDIGVDGSGYPAVRVSFSVDGESFSKVIVI